MHTVQVEQNTSNYYKIDEKVKKEKKSFKNRKGPCQNFDQKKSIGKSWKSTTNKICLIFVACGLTARTDRFDA